MERSIRVKLASGRVVTEGEIQAAGYALLVDQDENLLGALNLETRVASSVEAVFAEKFELPGQLSGTMCSGGVVP